MSDRLRTPSLWSRGNVLIDRSTGQPIEGGPIGLSSRAGLPSGDDAGTLKLVTDCERGVWISRGGGYISITGKTVNVEDFLATGNGSDNDAAAIQAAADAAGSNGTVYFPRPSVRYLIGSTTLRIYDGQRWIGGGPNAATAIRYTGSGSAIESVSKSTTRIFRGLIADLQIEGNGKVSGSVGLDFLRVDSFRIERVRLTGFDVGWKLDGSGGGYRNIAYGCVFTGNNTGVQIVSDANEQMIVGGEITSNSDYGLDVQGGNSITALHINWESNGVHVRTASENTRVLYGRMEAATTYRWQTTAAATYFSVRNVQFASGSGQSYSDAGQYSDIDDIDRNAVRGANLLRGGGLEHWSAGSAYAPDGWSCAGSVTVTREDTDVQEGSHSAILTAASSSSLLFQDYAIPAGWRDCRREYVVTARVKLGTSTQARVSPHPQDASGVTQGSILIATRQTCSGAIVTTAGWQTAYAVARPSGCATRIRVGLYPDISGGTGTATFDAVSLMPLGRWHEEFYNHHGDLSPSATKYLSVSQTINHGNTSSGAVDDRTVTVSGAALGDIVTLGIPHGSVTSCATGWYAWVSDTDTVTVRYWNASGADQNPASGVFRIGVMKH